MARRQIVVCDVCERVDRTTTKYRVWRDGLRVTIELCAEHGKPLESVLAKASKERGSKPRIEDTVTTMDALAEERERARQSAR
jgi:hypothetical protein